MPFPMVHLSIAYRMFDGHPHDAFLLGSIAPDAVQFRENQKLSKAASHLLDSSGSHPEWTGLIDFYKVRIDAYKGDAYKMFLIGYLTHIIADHLWARYKREISGSNRSVYEAIWNEENQYDFNLNRTVPWRKIVETQVISSTLFELRDIYTLDELDNWRRQLFIWLQTPQNEPFIENHYLKESNVGVFIDDTASEIYNWMKTKLGA
jgi:hypothetical protein